MLIWSLSQRPFVRLQSSRQAVQSCRASLSILLLLFAKFQLNNMNLLLTPSWFVPLNVKITQSELSPWVLTQKSQNRTHRRPSPSYHSSPPFLFTFSSSLPSVISPPFTLPGLVFPQPSSRPPVSFPVLSPLFFCLLPFLLFSGCVSSECSL